MITSVKRWKWGLAASMMLPIFSAVPSQAQDYPSRAIQLIAPSSAGGGFDVLGRIISDKWAAGLGQPVVIDVRPGANTVVGTSVVAGARPDGYTLVLASVAFSTNPVLKDSLPYKTPESFTPVALVAVTDNVLIANPKSGFKTVQDLIDAAQKDPGKIAFGSSGVGSGGHLSIELLKKKAGIDLRPIHYKGGGASTTALISGEVPVLVTALASAIPYIESGMAVPLAGTGTERSDLLPNVPTIAESGVSGYAVDGWYGILGPTGLPDDVVKKLYDTLSVTLADDEVKKKLSAAGFRVSLRDSAEFKRFISEDMEKWKSSIAGIKVPD